MPKQIIKQGEEKMQMDESFAEYQLAKFMDDFASAERMARSRQRKKSEEVKKGARQLREWDKIAERNTKEENSQK